MILLYLFDGYAILDADLAVKSCTKALRPPVVLSLAWESCKNLFYSCPCHWTYINLYSFVSWPIDLHVLEAQPSLTQNILLFIRIWSKDACLSAVDLTW